MSGADNPTGCGSVAQWLSGSGLCSQREKDRTPVGRRKRWEGKTGIDRAG